MEGAVQALPGRDAGLSYDRGALDYDPSTGRCVRADPLPTTGRPAPTTEVTLLCPASSSTSASPASIAMPRPGSSTTTSATMTRRPDDTSNRSDRARGGDQSRISTSAVIPLSYSDPLGLYEIYRDQGVTFHSYPGPPAGPGNFEHARHGPGQSYHIHVRDRAGNEARISTETWKPLTPEDERIFNRSKPIQAACEKLAEGEKKFLDRVNRQIFHRGGPTVNQLLRLEQMRSGGRGSGVRGSE